MGDDTATLEESRTVLATFFPTDEDGERVNSKHAKARADALSNYEAKVRGGHLGAERRWRPTPDGQDR